VTDTKIALITGANKGIGFEAARQLGEAGTRVLVGSRDVDRGQRAVQELQSSGIDAEMIRIDVSDPTSIRGAAEELGQKVDRLDILVNNAGIGLERCPLSELDIEVLRSVLETNFFGAFLTIQAFMPLLRKSSAGRIVNVSSGLGSLFSLSNPQWAAHQALYTPYSISKVALNSLTALLSAELIDSAIKVNSVEPGYTATDMTDQKGLQSVDVAARVVVKYALLPSDGPTGGYFDARGPMPW
jgi:NAD(P)-dependent dehydrogenase (short-subunit alcohol dehydrogenase family)